jgi:hypothetical protein
MNGYGCFPFNCLTKHVSCAKALENLTQCRRMCGKNFPTFPGDDTDILSTVYVSVMGTTSSTFSRQCWNLNKKSHTFIQNVNELIRDHAKFTLWHF